jgi:hypothetical protein
MNIDNKSKSVLSKKSNLSMTKRKTTSNIKKVLDINSPA